MLNPNFRPHRWALFFIIALTFAVSGCDRAGDAAGAGAAAPPRDAPYVVAEGRSVVIEDTLPGRVVAFREAQVRPQVGGILRERLFEEGEYVEEGQVLYRIDPDVFKADESAARANLTRARAGLKLAETELERAQQLSDSGISTGRDLDAATTNHALARADVQAASASLRRASLNLEFSALEAPLSGRIGISRVTEGALVSPADPQAMTTIHQISQVYVDVKQPLTRYEELKQLVAAGGMTSMEDAAVAILSMRDFEYPNKGKFLFTDTMVDLQTSEVTQRVLVPNEDGVLLPGMFVRARIPQGEVKNAIVLPQQAVRHDATFGAFILVIDEEDKVQQRHVSYGRVVEGGYLMTSGVESGDRVITEGHSTLQPGAAVNPVEWQAATAPQQP